MWKSNGIWKRVISTARRRIANWTYNWYWRIFILYFSTRDENNLLSFFVSNSVYTLRERDNVSSERDKPSSTVSNRLTTADWRSYTITPSLALWIGPWVFLKEWGILLARRWNIDKNSLTLTYSIRLFVYTHINTHIFSFTYFNLFHNIV